MAKRITTSKSKKKPAAPASTRNAEVASVSPVRKSVRPPAPEKVAKNVGTPVLSHDQIAERAYFISLSGTGGSEYDNWCRAETELRREKGI